MIFTVKENSALLYQSGALFFCIEFDAVNSATSHPPPSDTQSQSL